ncbi:hypothetical protein MSIBF_A1870007 [groundwater metagenome]|uniref:Uncharacterized protein n=1 Tax=groundwater metagenome TaxID=717931 RepID=A0A098E931_9ZZZZ
MNVTKYIRFIVMKTNNIRGLVFLTEKRNFKVYYKISNGNFPEQQNL